MSIENPSNQPPIKTPEQQGEKPVGREISYVIGKELAHTYEPITEQQRLSQIQAEKEQYEQWMRDNPELLVSLDNLREAGPEIKEIEDMIASFEAAHSLEELHSITEIGPGEEVNFPLRESAKKAIIPIVEKMKALEKETNISSQAYSEVRAAYKRLRNAIGAINSFTNKVDHNR